MTTQYRYYFQKLIEKFSIIIILIILSYLTILCLAKCSTYMLSSPTMHIAERSLTMSVIILVCLGSIALISNKRLLSSPRILSNPY